ERAVRPSRLLAHAVVTPVGPATGELVGHGVGVGDGGGTVTSHGDRDGQVLAGVAGAGQLGVLGGGRVGDRHCGDQADGGTAERTLDPHVLSSSRVAGIRPAVSLGRSEGTRNVGTTCRYG